MGFALCLSIMLASISIDASDPWGGDAWAARSTRPAPRLLVEIDDPWTETQRTLDALDPWDQSVKLAARSSTRARIDAQDPWSYVEP